MDFSANADGHGLQVTVEDVDLRVVERASDDDGFQRRGEVMKGRPDCGLGGAVAVVEGRVGFEQAGTQLA